MAILSNSKVLFNNGAGSMVGTTNYVAPDYYEAPQINLGTGSSDATRYIDQSLNTRNAALDTARKATEAANNALAPVNTAISQAESAYNEAMGNVGSVGNAAAGMQPIIANVGNAAGAMGQDIANVRKSAENLYPYANALQNYAETLWSQGVNLGGQGQDLMAQGQSLMNLNANAGGLVGEIVKSLGMIDPNAYVSMGAADVQNSFNNAQQQMVRNLTRAGADASSLKTAAMQTQFATSLAAALAGAKTRLRVQGIKDRFSALGTALNAAEGIVKQGAETMKTALGYQAQASQNQTDAGNIIAKMGDLYASAGGLQAKQGDLYAAQGKLQKGMGDLYSEQAGASVAAGNLANNIAGLGLRTAQTLIDAYGNETAAQNAVAAAQAEAAKYYQAENDNTLQVAVTNANMQARTNDLNAGLQRSWMSGFKGNKINGTETFIEGLDAKRGAYVKTPYQHQLRSFS